MVPVSVCLRCVVRHFPNSKGVSCVYGVIVVVFIILIFNISQSPFNMLKYRARTRTSLLTHTTSKFGFTHEKDAIVNSLYASTDTRSLLRHKTFVQAADPFNSSAYESFVAELERRWSNKCQRYYKTKDVWTWHDAVRSHLREKVVEDFSETDCFLVKDLGFSHPLSQEEREFPIAYSILVYKGLNRFTRLLRSVYRTSNLYCIHVDLKSEEVFLQAVKSIIGCFDNVFLAPRQVNVTWGDVTVLEPELVCLRALLEHKVKWRHFINLTGQEFPLKTNRELVQILGAMNGQNDAWTDPCTANATGYWPSKECKMRTPLGWRERWFFAERPPPHGIQLYKGQVHVLLSREFAQFAVYSPEATDLLDWLKKYKAEVPDEIFFTTLNNNPHLRPPGGNPDPSRFNPSIARYKVWMNIPGHINCELVLRNICMLSLRELGSLTNSVQLFANKFLEEYSPRAYSCLETWYHAKVLREFKTNRTETDLSVYRDMFNLI